MASNIIQLSFNGETSVVSEELVYKYDYGQQIEFTDLTLPEYFEVHFSNNKTGKATKQIGHNGVVDIPDRYLEIGSVYGWIFLHNTDSDGETEYEFKIPVKNRAMPSDGEVTPEQESAISQAIAALTSTQASVQALHDETEGYRDDASASSSYAHDAQTAAESAQDAAEMAETSAGFSKIAAEAAQSAAETAQGKAEDAQTAAESAQAAAEAARDDVLGMSAEAETLPAGSSATASYADGVLSLGIPRGDKGETGDTGATGETGNGIASVVKTSTSGLVDTYTITYTDGTTSTFDVTNGKDGEDSNVQDVQIDGTSILSDGVANIPTADTYYTSRYGVVKLADVVESGDNYNTIQLKYTRQGSAKSKTLATSAVATTSKRGLMSKDDKTKLDGIASGAEVNVQSDWNQTNTSADDYIKNKPSVPTKVSDLENDVPYAEEASLKSALPTDTASGDIASFSDGTDLFPALSVKAQIEPIQDLHGYDKPWSGGAGANKWDEEWELGSLDVSTGEPITDATKIRSKNFCPCISSTTYYLASSNIATYVWFYDADKNFVSFSTAGANRTFATPNNAHYFKIRVGDLSHPQTTYNHDIAINYPSSVTTYSPYSNICPISGHTECVTSVSGVNVWDEEWEVGSYDTGTGQKYDYYTDRIRTKNKIPVLPSTTYYKKAPQPSVYWNLYYDINGDYIGYAASGYNATFTTPSNAYFMALYTESGYGTTYHNDISINYPSTDHDYHAYNGDTYTTTLGRTVYGGTLDVVSGELVVDRAMVDMGTLNWGEYGSTDTVTQYYTINLDALAKPFGQPISDVFYYSQPIVANTIYMSRPSGMTYVRTEKDKYANPTAFKTAMSGHQLCYELATPQTYQLTPTEVDLLLGQNNLWTDCGSVEVTYKADTQKYIDKKFAELQALVLEQ